MAYKLVQLLLRTLGFILFWPIVTGRHHIPAQGPVIMAGNHLGAGEPILLVGMLRRQVTFPAKRELFRTDNPFRWAFSKILRALGQIPMDRIGGDASADGLDSIHQVLAKGGLVAILPEGHRSPDGRLYKGRTGVARLALSSDAQVMVFGCFRTRFVRRWLPFPWLYRPEIRIEAPFQFPEETKQAFRQAPNREQAGKVLRQATDEVMRRIQAITGQEMVDEYSYDPRKAGRQAKNRQSKRQR